MNKKILNIACAILSGIFVSAACCKADNEPLAPTKQISVAVIADKPVAVVSTRFLSVAVDMAQVVGGVFWGPDETASYAGSMHVPPFDFSRPRLRLLARELAPAYLRIGGTAADETYYNLSELPEAERSSTPPGYQWTLTRKQWDGVGAFAKDLDFRLLLTLNAGMGPRDTQNRWQPDNALTLLHYTQKAKMPVDVWELGNEINGYPLIHKFFLSPEAYAEDLKTARQLLGQECPSAKLAGPSCAFWPEAGDFSNFFEEFMEQGGHLLDIITWHYYPQQSKRCAIATRQATPTLLLDPDNLDEVDHWEKVVKNKTLSLVGSAPIWLSETGNAQCGGAPGISNAFVGGIWWLDHLGKMARQGQEVVVRQTLAGSDYGLIDDLSLIPNPDYWNSVLWKRLMGPRVLAVQLDKPDRRVRVYAHCSHNPSANEEARVNGKVSVLVINVDQQQAARVHFDAAQPPLWVYLITADDLQSKSIRLNGELLEMDPDGHLPELNGQQRNEPYLDLPPTSYAFVSMSATHINACR